MPDDPYPARRDNAPGSPSTGEPDFLVVGKLRRPHGVNGEILMDVYTDFPERICPGAVLYAGPQRQSLEVSTTRWHQSAMLLALKGFTDREAAAELGNLLVYVRTAERDALPEGEFYHHQLIGMRVVEEDGKFLGIVKEILETGANDILVVKTPESREALLPLIEEVVLDISLGRHEIQVHLLPGLID
ncbi:MAG TPA: ribosome maturation factor RimM [Anaerolineales bacterium]|jgi:16S rRNA processing protein RimM